MRGLQVPQTLHNEAYRTLINLLVDARRDAGLTQSAVAKRMGRPQSFIAKIEGCERRLDVIEFLQLAAAVDANPLPIVKRAGEALSNGPEWPRTTPSDC